MPDRGGDITRALDAWRSGDATALDRLVPLVYGPLRALARGYLRREREGHTLQPTALVHELFLKLNLDRQMSWQNRAHFFAVAATSMRRILVDHARARQAQRRDGGLRVPLEGMPAPARRGIDLLALDEALGHLEMRDAQLARVVELRFFAGLTVDETAEVVGVSARTVKRDWNAARSFLRRELTSGP